MDVNLTSDAKVKLEPGAKLTFSYEVCEFETDLIEVTGVDVH